MGLEAGTARHVNKRINDKGNLKLTRLFGASLALSVLVHGYLHLCSYGEMILKMTFPFLENSSVFQASDPGMTNFSELQSPMPKAQLRRGYP
jgi:hypothetical protein